MLWAILWRTGVNWIGRERVPYPMPQLLAPAQLFLASSTVLSVSCWAEPACSFPCPAASSAGCSSKAPSTGHWAMSQPWAAQLCPVSHRASWRQKEPQLDLRRGPSISLSGPRKQGFSENSEDLEVWGLLGLAFVFWDFFFCKFLLLLFSSRGTRSKLHKPPVGSHSHHLGILTAHPESMFSLVFETCHVRTAWSILEATLGKKKSSSC